MADHIEPADPVWQFISEMEGSAARVVLGRKLWLMMLCHFLTGGLLPTRAAMQCQIELRAAELAEEVRVINARYLLGGEQ